MTIKNSDGRTFDAVLLTRTENTIRAAMEGADDVMEFTNIRGTWVSADCEPVTIQFAWELCDRKPAITEADCCCSPELAARLLHLLFSDSSEDEIAASAASCQYLTASQPC
jgi:hypothetical protein